MESLNEGRFFYLVFSLEEEENECVKEKLVVMCEKCYLWKQMCVNKRTWREVTCNK
jgi:hypothetical protein